MKNELIKCSEIFMGKNSFTSLLVGLLFLCGAATVVLALLYVQNVGAFRQLQAQANAISAQQNVIRSLAAETLEYSKRDHGVDPILQAVGVKPATAAKTGK